MVCSRFSAWSKTSDRGGLEDLVGDLGAVEAELRRAGVVPSSVSRVVHRRQAVQELGRRACRSAPSALRVTWYGQQQRRPGSPTARADSPMLTQTSV